MRAGVYGRQSRGSKKSIKDQMEAGHAVSLEQGWEDRPYSDEVSASWFGTKQRGGWAEVLRDVEAGELDVLVLWESSRGDRRLTEWSRLLDTAKERGVRIHITSHERTYDLAVSRDWKTLAMDGVDSQAEVNVLSARIRRGVAAAARDGRPAAGPIPYGYRRVYDQMSGALVAQEPDDRTAPIVTEVFARVAKSEPLGRIADDLNARGVTPPGERTNNRMTSKGWYRERIRKIAQSRTYLGERKHKGDWHPAGWPALTDAETFAAANRVLAEPGRLTTGPHQRPGKQVHLLSYLAKCLNGHPVRGKSGEAYDCGKGCFQIKREKVDGLIRDLVIARLSSPDLYAALEQEADAADETLKAARAEVAQLARDLDEYRALARGRKISPASFAELEAGLLSDIEAAQARIDAATIPTDLEGWVGPEADVRARWENAAAQARRTVIRALGLVVTLHPAGQNSYAFVTDRVVVDWVSDR